MKITKIQNEFKIISSLTVEEIERLANANQDVLYEDKKPVYGISVTKNCPTFNGKSVAFNERSDSGKAMLTMVCDPETEAMFGNNEDAIKHFTENNLEAINNLISAEPKFKAALETLDARVAEVVENIEIINVD